MKLLKLIRVVLINLSLLLVGLLGVELAFGNWFSSDPLTYLNVPRNGKWNFETYYSDSADFKRTNIYTRDHYGLRGEYGDVRDIDMVTLGGSTAEQRYVDDSETWQATLQKKLSVAGKNFQIANSGLSGRTTFGHIHDFRVWFPLIPDLNPKYYLLYVGINDMFHSKTNGSFDQLNKKKQQPLKENIKIRSVLYKIFRTSIGAFLAKKYNLTHTYIDYSKAEWTDQSFRDNYAELLVDRLQGYRERLYVLSEEIKKRNAVAIFVTQKRGDVKEDKGKLIGLVKTNSDAGPSFYDSVLGSMSNETANGLDYHLILTEFNKVLMEVCHDIEGVCLDLAAEVEFETGDFYDHLHTTGSGSIRIGNYLYGKLKDRI